MIVRTIRLCSVAIFSSLLLYPALLAQKRDAHAGSRQSSKDDSTAERQTEMSSSNDTRIDLSPPKDDAKNHPESGAAMMDTEGAPPKDVDEMHPWDPHRAAKDLEVGDYYLKLKNYRGAMWRYKDALIYKPNDAVANFRLAECEEKTHNPADAVQHYEAYLKILPEGPFAADARKALERLKTRASK
jgi:tetratricopeptide (TPR) repeat protein